MICVVTARVWDTYDYCYNRDTQYKDITRKFPLQLQGKYLTKFDFGVLVLAEFDRYTIVEVTSIVEQET